MTDQTRFEASEIDIGAATDSHHVTLIFRSIIGESREVTIPRRTITVLEHRLTLMEDVVDAEFTEADDLADEKLVHVDEPQPDPNYIPTHVNTQKARLPWSKILAAGVVGLAIYGLFFRSNHSQKTDAAALPAGWLELLNCSQTTSFDGKKTLSVWLDRSAELTEQVEREGKKGDVRLSKGEWSYDEIAKEYAITLNGETTNYTLVSPDDSSACILAKGNPSAANLLESWFASFGEGPSDDRPD